VAALLTSGRSSWIHRDRINNGKLSAMPAFGSTLGDAQIDQIITYIRELRPHRG
jgi:mono/diheme cytochrome c family protein